MKKARVRLLILTLHPLGRLGEPGDIASAICGLSSPGQSWITGQVFHVGGSLSPVQPRYDCVYRLA